MCTLSRDHQSLSRKIQGLIERLVSSWEEEVTTWKEDLTEIIERDGYSVAFARAVSLDIPQEELLGFLQDQTKSPVERQNATLAGQKLEKQGNLEAALLAYSVTEAFFLRIRALLRHSRPEDAAEILLTKDTPPEFLRNLEPRLLEDPETERSVLDAFWYKVGRPVPTPSVPLPKAKPTFEERSKAIEFAINANNPQAAARLIAKAPSNQQINLKSRIRERIPESDLRTTFLILSTEFIEKNKIDMLLFY